MESILKPKKTPKADLERRRFVYFEIGLVIVLALVFGAFNYSTGEEEYYFAPKDSSDFYVAKEVYIFKPLPEKVKPSAPQATKTKPVKIDPTKVKVIPIDPKPVVVELPKDQPKPDTATVKKEPAEPLPANLIRVDKKPQFPGGEIALNDYLKQNLQYPDFARKNSYSGPVIMSFMVGPDGKLHDIKVQKGVRNSGLDDAVVKVFSSMPAWEPGYRKGKPVDFLVTFPIRFDLEQ